MVANMIFTNNLIYKTVYYNIRVRLYKKPEFYTDFKQSLYPSVFCEDSYEQFCKYCTGISPFSKSASNSVIFRPYCIFEETKVPEKVKKSSFYSVSYKLTL